jgi:hypothetical protein
MGLVATEEVMAMLSSTRHTDRRFQSVVGIAESR